MALNVILRCLQGAIRFFISIFSPHSGLPTPHKISMASDPSSKNFHIICNGDRFEYTLYIGFNPSFLKEKFNSFYVRWLGFTNTRYPYQFRTTLNEFVLCLTIFLFYLVYLDISQTFSSYLVLSWYLQFYLVLSSAISGYL